MITVMTLNTTGRSPAKMRERLAPLHRKVDLLCCRSDALAREERRSRAARSAPAAADALGLACSCLVPLRPLRRNEQADPSAPEQGLAMFTGPELWMLNSGSFTVAGSGVVQFAVLRKQGRSLLALNAHLAGSRPQQHKEMLAELFRHPRVQETYGAMVLCIDSVPQLDRDQWLRLSASSPYRPHSAVLSSVDDGLLCLYAHKNWASQLAKPTVLQAAPAPALTFAAHRVTSSSKHQRTVFPLSFREQWLGYRELRPQP
ncbi:MAG: hypothetical protein ACOX5Z_08260 [Desulfobulbus sp.]